MACWQPGFWNGCLWWSPQRDVLLWRCTPGRPGSLEWKSDWLTGMMRRFHCMSYLRGWPGIHHPENVCKHSLVCIAKVHILCSGCANGEQGFFFGNLWFNKLIHLANVLHPFESNVHLVSPLAARANDCSLLWKLINTILYILGLFFGFGKALGQM